MISFFKKKIHLILYFFFFILFFLIILIYFKDGFSDELLRNNFNYLLEFKNKFFIETLLILVLSSILLSFLGFALPVLFFNGFLFGSIIGSIISLLTLTLGSCIFYYLNKNIITDNIKDRFKSTFLKINKLVNNNEFLTVFFLRFFGFGMPFIAHNILPMIFKIKNKSFFWGTFFGLIPLTMQSFIAGGLRNIYENNLSLNEILNEKFVTYPLILIIIVIIFSLVFVKKLYKK